MQTTFSSADIVCGGCTSAIKKVLGELNGVSDVAVEIALKRVTVAHATGTSREALTTALDRAGFPVAG